MRARRFLPSFDSLSARITPSGSGLPVVPALPLNGDQPTDTSGEPEILCNPCEPGPGYSTGTDGFPTIYINFAQ